jgi:hypothetical protein
MEPVSFGIFEVLTQYGVLGIVSLGLGAALWYLLKRQIASEDRLKQRVDELQRELNDYIRNDQSMLKSTVENNTKALQELRDLVLRTRN